MAIPMIHTILIPLMIPTLLMPLMPPIPSAAGVGPGRTCAMRSLILLLICASSILALGCATADGNYYGVAVMEQTYEGEKSNGEKLKIKIVDTPFSHNISNSSAKYTYNADGSLTVSIGAGRDVDQTPQAQLMGTIIQAAGAAFGAYLAGPPGAAMGATAAHALTPAPTPTPGVDIPQ